MPCWSGAPATTTSTTSARSTAPTSTAIGSSRTGSRTATSCRSASSSSRTSPGESDMTLQHDEAQIDTVPPPPMDEEAPPAKAMTIGALCKALEVEFPDISISKIRYLEDQKLLAPRRTPGGYRLYSPGDVARLRTILRLQRDEFLPLRVIRQELASGRTESDLAAPAAAGDGGSGRRKRRPSVTAPESGALYSLEDVVEETRADPRLVAELEDYGVIKGENRAGTKYYDETEREIVRAVTELARYGVEIGRAHV